MAYQFKNVPRSRTWYYPDGTLHTLNRDDFLSFIRFPDKANGSFITFPDGSKFRAATNYARNTFWVEPKTPVNTEYKWGSSDSIRYRYSSSPGGVHVDIVPGVMGWDLFHTVTEHVYSPPFIQQSLRNECSTKALLDLADAKASIGENLATLSQIIRLVKDPLSSIIKDVKKIREKRNLWSLFAKSYRELAQGRGLDGAAREYLKYVYGWKPLVQDIFGIMELAKASGEKPLLIHAEGKGKGERFHKDRRYGPGSESVITIAHDLTSITRAKCSIWAQPDPNWAGSRTLNQLGLLNPASLAWELVPASFVVDWVLPIGPVLQALTAPAGLAFVNGSMSHRVSARGAWSQDYVAEFGPTITDPVPGTGLMAYEGYRREALGSWPQPGFWFDPDPLRLKSDGSDRVFKALALSLLQMKSL